MQITTIRSWLLLGALALGAPALAGTVNNTQLQTWWHDAHELNANTPVADQAVRRSTFYDVRVSTVARPDKRYKSFTYMSIPRSGRDKWLYDSDDGAEFADTAKLTMSWSTFLYGADTWVEVRQKDGEPLGSADDVVIRPSGLGFEKQLVDDRTVRIRVPYSPKGYRFSVEFKNQLYTAFNDLSGWSGKLNDEGRGRAIHEEPRNALLIFAEPKLDGAQAARLVPSTSSGSIHYPAPGKVANLNTVSEEIIFFKPGVYYMDWNYHAQLPANVKWVYFAPGAYVKGAFQFLHDMQSAFKFTGYGVLSGEKYVYEPDTNNGYKHKVASDCHGSCVKLLRLQSSAQQQELDLQGVTFADPPYHSFVVYGIEDTFRMRVENFKQVGGWYWQTDGMELYKGSTMKNTFFHANDDVLKMYASDVSIDNTVIWKNENGPVIQWGWKARDMSNVHVKDTFVIHNKMYWSDVKTNTCILNASPSWSNSEAPPDASKLVSDLFFENIQVEGKTNCAMRIYALANTENVHIKNLWIDGWNDLDSHSQQSTFKRMASSLTIGNEALYSRGLKIENYRVGNEHVTKYSDNWRSDGTGRLNFDGELWDSWNAW